MDARWKSSTQEQKHSPDWKHGNATGRTTRNCENHREIFEAPCVEGAQGILAPHVASNLNRHKRWETVPAALEVAEP